MSCEKGNNNRSRPQKHKNKTSFRNDLHDSSGKQKLINNLTFTDTCQRCAEILRWKVQYRKYKPLTQPKTCNSCSKKTIKLAYRIVCQECADKANICPKCGKSVDSTLTPSTEVQVQTLDDLGPELLQNVKALPERKRRKLERLIKKGKPQADCEEKPTCFWTRDELSSQLELMSISQRELVEDDADSEDSFEF